MKTTNTATANSPSSAKPDSCSHWSDAAVMVAYGAERHARLVEVKDRWDPENVFNLNHNIRPSSE